MTKEKHWYLLTCKPAQDHIAEQHLINQGYEVYRPLVKRTKKRRGKMVEITESLFPRYIFIHLNNTTDNWAPIRSTRGVANFVRFGTDPCKAPDELIKTLQSHEDELANKVIDLDKFKKGDTVLINTGPFKGLTAIFNNYHNSEMRSLILIEMMGNLVKTPIETSSISTI